MNKLLLTIAIAVTLCAAVSAQTPSSPFRFYVGGGLSRPLSPMFFETSFKTGFHGMGGVGYAVAPYLQAVAKAEYHYLALHDAGVDGGDLDLWMFGLDARAEPSLPTFPLKPFAFGGLGIARAKTSEITGVPWEVYYYAANFNKAITEPYVNFGVGLDLKGGPMFGLFVQARYVQVFMDGDDWTFVPITAGGRFF